MRGVGEDELDLRSEIDIVTARRATREVLSLLGFGQTDVTRIITAVSELARNTVKYAKEGTMTWRCIVRGGKCGIELQFRDQGPGIPDIALALQNGYSTCGGIGMGLPGAKRLMDELEIQSEIGRGTT
jgi:serine/threonine-protein kinase RsbT